MYVTVNRTALSTGLNIVQRAVPAKPPLAQLGCVHFKTEKGVLQLTGTDLELTLRTWVPADIGSEGEALLPARLLADLVRRIPDETITLQTSAEGYRTTFKYGENRMVFAGLDPGDFPTAALATEGPTLCLAEGILREALREVIFAASTDDNRPLLSAVCFTVDTNATEMVATDTYRLAWCRLIHDVVDGKLTFLIPLRALAELTRLLTAGEGMIDFVLGQSSVTFRHTDFLLSSRLLEGQFPDYRTFLPQSWSTRIRVSTRPFLEALERASLVVSKPPVVRLRLEGGRLALEAVGENGRLEEQLPLMAMEGEPLEIAFNPGFVADALRAQPGQEAVIEFTGALGAAIFRPVEERDYFSLLLPVRLL